MAQLVWDIFMGQQRAHIVLPDELIQEIDSLVGPRGRSAFLVETARVELRRRRLLSFLHDDKLVWKEERHPELAKGTGAWVKELRRQSDLRTSSLISTRKIAR
jgi:hypothetical protein